MPNLRQKDLSNKTHSNELLSHSLMHRTRTQDEWWNQNHFGSQLFCINFNPFTFHGSHKGAVDSIYNINATVNYKRSKKNDSHYMAVNKNPTLKSWYKYDNYIVKLVKFVKQNTNSVLMDFQKTTSILFYIDVKYVSVCHNNLCNNNEVIDITGRDRPPVIDQSQDATSSLLSSNTLSSLSSYGLSLLSSDNSSRSLTSVRSKTNSDDNNLFLSSSQLKKIAGATQLTLNLPIFFGPFAIGLWIWCQKVSTITHIKNGV
jgi:hypothetical protein